MDFIDSLSSYFDTCLSSDLTTCLTIASVILAFLAIIVSLYTYWRGSHINVKGYAESPILSFEYDKIPCEIKIVNHGSRQTYISSIGIHIRSRIACEVCNTLTLHDINNLKLEDSQQFKKTLFLIKDLTELKRLYDQDTYTFDRLFPCKVTMYLETTKEKKIKLAVDKKMKSKIIDFIKGKK